ncbi:vacuolar protein sorting-associated protein 13C [Fopius arisanus]|uniref:Vacuolar protein sorting-associated protein 13C n=1 Tax=Fopius arisanus TaxID=64838 RepID=A0A9R1T6D8_9HYME|nr:PREDICTED: vacuolar protein sorting-associated protein 13C-like [Fopius arisanus]
MNVSLHFHEQSPRESLKTEKFQDIYIVAVPSMSGNYDEEIQKRLTRATKRKLLEDLEGDGLLPSGLPSGLLDSLMASLIKNFQITVTNVHVRYEEKFSCSSRMACGLCIQSFSIATTNNKWKPGVTPPTSTSIYQLIRVESLSLYLNPNGSPSLEFYPNPWDFQNLVEWKAIMHRSLRTFSINTEEFDFLIKPFTTKIKVIVNQSSTGQPSRMLVDIVLQDVAMQLSEGQFSCFCKLWRSLQQGPVERNRLTQRSHPTCLLRENPRAWWRYALTAVLEQNIRPYTWEYIKNHRRNYKKYKETFMQTLIRPNDTELKLDLQKYEDCLSILNIIIAREEGKIELKKREPDCVTVETLNSNIKLLVNLERLQEVSGVPVSPKSLKNHCEDLAKLKLEPFPNSIERKYNFTLANWSFSLLTSDSSSREREILVVTMGQFLMSIETRPQLSAFKISARAESLVLEGASSVENDLVPLVTADNILTGNTASNFLAIDFEKNPKDSDFNYEVNVRLEAFEVTYHDFAMREIINYFKRNKPNVSHFVWSMQKAYGRTRKKFLGVVSSIMNRRLRVNLKLDVKGPYIVFPDGGSHHPLCGNIIILDLGRLTLKTELQPPEVQLEDATLMELEELLYDRIHVVLSDTQVLICHSGDDWRDSRNLKDSDFHIVPKIQANVTISFSIKPDYRLLPRLKLNVSISTVKFNVSKHKLVCLNDFLSQVSIPHPQDLEDLRRSLLRVQENVSECLVTSTRELTKIRTIVALASFVIIRKKSDYGVNGIEPLKTDSERSVVSSEFSEEDLEQWIKSVNFSGFDDNISPHNNVNVLLRIVIGELSIHASYSKSNPDSSGNSCHTREKPYLILRLCTIYLESALMEFGPALQFGVGTIVLADKTNAGITGSYLELVSGDGNYDVVGVAYRKVRANCPDFKTHFKSIEQSLVVNTRNINVVFHKQAFVKLNDYLEDLLHIPFSYNAGKIPSLLEVIKYLRGLFRKREADPPVPAGAIKLSYSARLNSLLLKLCTKDMDLLEIRVNSIESDCIYNANERMILRAHVGGISIEDLSDITLYSKILSTEDDKLLDLKYVRHAPKLYSSKMTDVNLSGDDDVKTDGSFKLSLGKINFVVLSEVFRNCRHFGEPFGHLLGGIFPNGLSRIFVNWSVEELRKSPTKLHISIDLQGPTFLFPQKRDLPNTLVLDLGLLTIENFFKRNGSDEIVVDNLLVKLEAVVVSRAIMTLAGVLKVQEPIVEHVEVRLDVKRNIECWRGGAQVYGLCEVVGSVEQLVVNLSRKDLAGILNIWEDNIGKIVRMKAEASGDFSQGYCGGDATMRKLEVFFTNEEHPVCEVNMKVSFDGLQVNLFSDSDEVLSSPVRDLNNGLGKLNLGEVMLSFELYSNRSMSMKISLRTCTLEDTRKEPAVIRKIIQSPAKSAGLNFESVISVSEPPVFDFTFTQAPAGDKCIDMLIEETRVNLSIPFFLQLTKYFVESLPTEQIDRGVINEAYEGNNHVDDLKTKPPQLIIEQPMELEEQSGTSVSIRIRKPEILLFGDLKASNAHAILVQAELMIESSRHLGSSSVVCSFSNVCAKSKSQERFRRQPPQWVLRPCDIDVCSREKSTDDQGQIILEVSSVDIHLSAGTVCTLNQILRDASEILKIIDAKFESKNDFTEIIGYADLWSPKKIFSSPYRGNPNGHWEMLSPRAPPMEDPAVNLIKILSLKPFEIHVILEMEDTVERIPMVKAEIELGASITSLNSTYKFDSSFKIHAFCYNASRGSWEPFIELCTKDDVTYYPWELSIKVYQAESHELNSCPSPNPNQTKNPMKRSTSRKKRNNQNSTEDDQSNEDMLFIHPDTAQMCSKVSLHEYSFEHDEDSDSNEDEAPEKLARSFSHLFTNDETDEDDDDDTDSDTSSKCEDEGLELTPEHVVSTRKLSYSTVKPLTRALTEPSPLANYIVISAEDRINFTVTQNTITILDIILNIFTKNQTGIPIVPTNAGKLSLINEIGHASRIELIAEEKGTDSVSRILAWKEFNPLNSPTSAPSTPDSEFCMSEHFMESAFTEDSTTTTTSLNGPVIFPDDSPVHIYNSMTEESLRIHIDTFEDTMIYCPKWQGTKLIRLRPTKNSVTYHLIVEVSTDHQLHRTITVRAPLQVKNETCYALGLYYKKKMAVDLDLDSYLNGEASNPFDDSMRITVIEPHDVYNVPMYITYHFTIHLAPVHFTKFEVSPVGISWKELSDHMNSPKDIYCTSTSAIFGVKVFCSENSKYSKYQWANSGQVPQYLITIVPPLVFDNKLPFVVDINVPSIEYEVRIEPGQRIDVYNIRCDADTTINFKIQNYLSTQWAGTFKLSSELDRKLVKMFADGETDAVWRPFVLCVELNKSTSWTVVIYSEYWIINKTGLPLKLQETLSNTVEIPDEELIVFSQRKNRRKPVMLKIHQSDWSLPFSLDAINSMSLIACKDMERRRKYRILTEIVDSSLSPTFTRIITFLPYFFIKNTTKRALRFMEENEDADLWNDLLPGQGTAFWPYTDSLRMRVKWKNSQLVSQHFSLTSSGKIVLRMENGSALCVDIDGGNSSPYCITFERYVSGDAPVRVDNLCEDLFLKLNQSDLGQVALLSPYQSLLYTWDDPTESRELIWNVYNTKTKGYPAIFEADGFGQEVVTFRTLKRSPEMVYSSGSRRGRNTRGKSRTESHESQRSVDHDDSSSASSDEDSTLEDDKIDKLDKIKQVQKIQKNKTIIYWISYLEKRQRVLTFTQDEHIFLKMRAAVDPEYSRTEVFLGLSGVGISIVADDCTVSRTSSRELAYASVTDSSAHWEVDIGKRWKSLTLELNAWLEDKYRTSAESAKLDNSIDVNFSKMHITKPFFGKLRRTYCPGIWMHLRRSNTLTYLQGYIHRVQVDDQKTDSVFPVVLRPGGKRCWGNGLGGRMKHSLEFCLVRQARATCNVFKRIQVVLREMHVNLQEEFLVGLVQELIPKNRDESKTSLAGRLKADLANVYFPLGGENRCGRGDFVESLYVAPVKVHVKLLASAEGREEVSGFGGVFDYASKGSFLKQAEFRLPQFERTILRTGLGKLSEDLWKGYCTEIRHQFNVTVQGITVLGNPFGYNFKAPGDAFYDTDGLHLQGDETAEKLSHSVCCLLGYSSMDGLQAPLISLNHLEQDCQGGMRPKVSRFESTDTPLSALTLDRSYSIGVELEMSGLIVKPTDNTHQEELKYSLKELGKGILSLAKLEDGKSSLRIEPGLILDTIKRAQERGYNFVSRVRFPRYINPYSTVELYSTYKARGMYLLNTITKSEYQNSETYWAHAALSSDGKHIALVSLQKIYLLEKRCSIWASWNVAWSIETKELTEAPTISENKLILHVNKPQQPQIMSQSPPDWYLECNDITTLEWLSKKINTAMILNLINSRCRTV